MESFFADYYERLADLHRMAGEAIAGLDEAALDWQPGEEMNSLTVLVTHTAWAERYWVGVMAGGDMVARDRPAEFMAQGQTAVSLQTLLNNTLAHSQQTLTALTVKDLGRGMASPMHDKRPFAIGWSLLHALEHTAEHVGQMQLTRQLWEQHG